MDVLRTIKNDPILRADVYNAWAFLNPEQGSCLNISLNFGLSKEDAIIILKRLAQKTRSKIKFDAFAPTQPTLEPIEDGITIQIHGFPTLIKFKKLEPTTRTVFVDEGGYHREKERAEEMLLEAFSG